MRRVLSALLALALCALLTTPALANGRGLFTVGEDYQQFIETFPAQYRAQHADELKSLDIEAWFQLQGYYGGDKKAFMVNNNLADEAAFRIAMEEDYALWIGMGLYQKKTVDAYRAAHPGELEAVDVNAHLRVFYQLEGDDPLEDLRVMCRLDTREEALNHVYDQYICFRQVVAWWVEEAKVYEEKYPEVKALDANALIAETLDEPKETYMANNCLRTEEELRAALTCNYGSNRDYEIAQQEENDQYIRNHGGVPGQLNVMINGKCLTFGAAKPYVEDSVTYVPADVLSKALGTQVAANGNGYVPFRTTCEAAGYQVSWEFWREIATAVSREGLIAELDKRFTVVNRVPALIPLMDLVYSGSLGWSPAEDTSTAGTAFIRHWYSQWGELTYYLEWDTALDGCGDWELLVGDYRFTQTDSGWTYLPLEDPVGRTKDLALTITKDGQAKGTFIMGDIRYTFHAKADKTCQVTMERVQ